MKKIKKSTLKEYIKKLAKEIKDDGDLDEMSTTASAQGYQSPYAFSAQTDDDKWSKEKKKDKKHAAVMGYTGTTGDEEKKNTLPLKEWRSNYHVFKTDSSSTPVQKIGRSIREVYHGLREIDRVLDLNLKLKEECNMSTSGFWKRAQRQLGKLDEKVMRIHGKILRMKG